MKVTTERTIKTDQERAQAIEDGLACKNIFQDQATKLPIKFDELVEFVKQNYNNFNAITEAQKLVEDPTKIIDAIEKVYPLALGRKIKGKLTKIKNNIFASVKRTGIYPSKINEIPVYSESETDPGNESTDTDSLPNS